MYVRVHHATVMSCFPRSWSHLPSAQVSHASVLDASTNAALPEYNSLPAMPTWQLINTPATNDTTAAAGDSAASTPSISNSSSDGRVLRLFVTGDDGGALHNPSLKPCYGLDLYVHPTPGVEHAVGCAGEGAGGRESGAWCV